MVELVVFVVLTLVFAFLLWSTTAYWLDVYAKGKQRTSR